ncbi:aminotransferase A [Virgibacillus xinjiangensis]|uniref:Aminotransferase n=1 Tax=Virgibacillus xinjiangensis TaxID=393090 RepID=A0ABV7CUH4_9BACI
MEHLLNENVKSIEISGIRKFSQLVSEEEDVVSLTIGQPDFDTPTNVKQAAEQALKDNRTTYTSNAGILELRKAISTFQKNHYGLEYDANSEIIVTNGASQAIDITFRTILRPGDEVILPAPIYPGYEPLIHLAGGKAVHVDTTESDFKLTKQLLMSEISDKTKCVVLPSPSNPTGASYSQEEYRELVDVLKEKDIFILSDEIYSELSYGQQHTSIAGFPEVKNQTIVINGVSKSHSMTGFRIGYALAPGWLQTHMLKVHQYNVSCASSISQYAALEALQSGTESTEQMRAEYKKRRDYVYNRLVDMGLEVSKPEGAFYLFPKFPIKELTSFELGLDLVRTGGVALVPGSSFSSEGERYMRLSYAYSMDTLKKGLDRLEIYLQQAALS